MPNRELIVIPPSGEEASNYHQSKVSDGHRDNLIRYIRENKINIDIYNDPFIYTLGLEMAYLNYIVIGIDDTEFCVYLPSDITNAQAQWFYKRELVISQFEVFIINVNKDENEEYEINHIEGYEPGYSSTKRLYKEIENKTVKQEEVKVR